MQQLGVVERRKIVTVFVRGKTAAIHQVEELKIVRGPVFNGFTEWDPDISSDTFPGHILPDISPIPPPFLHVVRHFPLPPPPANLQYKTIYR